MGLECVQWWLVVVCVCVRVSVSNEAETAPKWADDLGADADDPDLS